MRGLDKSPEGLAARAIAGFSPVAENGIKAALTTGMTTDRKSLIFLPAVVSWQKSEYPGVAKLVSRRIWDAEIARSNRVTRTKAPRSVVSGGFSLFIAAQNFSYGLLPVILYSAVL